MQNPRLAGRYAKSVMDLAKEKNILDVVFNDMLFLDKICNHNKEINNLLKSPIVTGDKKTSIIKEISKGRIGELSSAFIDLIIRKKREYFLPEIVKAFIDQYKEFKNIVIVNLYVAHEMDEAMKNQMLDHINKQLQGKTIELHVHIKESLIGGFVLESNNKSFDASIARDLKDIRDQFMQNIYVPNIR
ncbi:MAG: ATP synthase F1 subunit delta [Chitinophagaceae bacterium]|nr:ATP synthase F1 subunit delta [Chitinophagaceae bacterium]